MFTLKSVYFPLATAACMLVSAPAAAISPLAYSFGEIEFRTEPAALVDDVRADLVAHIPAGSPIGDARVLLGNAGARCRAPQADGTVRCRYYGAHFQGDAVQSVSWTVNLATAGEKVRSFTVARFPAKD